MTPLPDEQPLSRRQLREQQRTTEPSAPSDNRSRRVSTTSPVTGGAIPDVNPAPEPSLSTAEVAQLEEAEAAGLPLTRRQARDLERVRTASLSVIESASGEATDAEAPAVEAQSGVEAEPEPVEPASVDADAPAPKSKKNGKRTSSPAGNRLPSFVPSSAKTVAEPEIVDAEIVGPEETTAEPAPPIVFELPHHSESAFGPAATAQTSKDDGAPQLAGSFGHAVLRDEKSAGKTSEADEPFDQIIARGLEEAGNGVSTSSIILPIMPNSHPLTGPLSANGNVVVTGSIDLPSGMGSNGAHPDHFDKSDIDAMFDAEDETRPATAGTPVSASKAVSTHTATRDVITPPAPARSNRLLLILAITAGVLAVAVLAVIIVGIAAGAFQSQ